MPQMIYIHTHTDTLMHICVYLYLQLAGVWYQIARSAFVTNRIDSKLNGVMMLIKVNKNKLIYKATGYLRSVILYPVSVFLIDIVPKLIYAASNIIPRLPSLFILLIQSVNSC